ncbi:MAG: alpha/beta fold hydrolase [Actinomycetota bacterium]|nr:alpha/beta fold hydrolase [Actinomycetota bacterium]
MARLPGSGVTLEVVDEGGGPAVLLLHGFPDSSRLWRKQIPALVAAGFRAVAPDLRGFGESDKPSRVADYAMPRILADLRAVLDALEVDRASVVGHDWGAIAGWALAGWYPERVERLVAISVGHPKSYLRAAFSSTQAFRSLYALFFQMPVVSEAAIRARDWALLRQALGRAHDFEHYLRDLSRPGALTAALNWYRANGRIDRLARYPTVTVPTLAIWGSKDPALGEKQMAGSGKYVDADWRYETIEGGHWLPITRSDEVNGLLIEFLRGGLPHFD